MEFQDVYVRVILFLLIVFMLSFVVNPLAKTLRDFFAFASEVASVDWNDPDGEGEQNG